MSSSIAAAVAIVIGLIVTIGTPNRATAAEELKQVADANHRYQGWVHLRVEAVDQSNPATQPIASETHFNTADGTWASVFHDGGTLRVQMYVPSKNEEVVYDGQSNELHLGQTWHEFSTNWAKSIMEYPLTITDGLAMAKEQGIAAPQIKKSSENGLDRFDITMANDAKPSIVWVDPATKLIQKMQSDFDGHPGVTICTYGAPEIHDAYDLGVPRSAVVVDARPPANVEQLYARLQKRSEKAFGETYVVLIAETDSDNKPEAITLIAHDHDKLLNHRYLLGAEGQFWIGFHQPVPKGWPTPALAEITDAIKHHPPVQGYIADGRDGWTFFVNDQKHRIESHKIGVDSAIRARFDIPGRFWPSQMTIGAFGAGSTSEIIFDKNLPGLIGLRVEKKPWIGLGDPNSKQTHADQSTYWLDPAHDDLMVSSFVQGSWPGSFNLTNTKVIDLKQLPGGAWYPARLQSDVTQTWDNPKQSTHSMQEDVFQIFPGERLDASLYSDPAKYPATAPAISK